MTPYKKRSCKLTQRLAEDMMIRNHGRSHHRRLHLPCAEDLPTLSKNRSTKRPAKTLEPSSFT